MKIANDVTTCVVVWIEILNLHKAKHVGLVTTCVVVWIEIEADTPHGKPCLCHHLRGGVD